MKILDNIGYWLIYCWISFKIFLFRIFVWFENKWKEYEKIRFEMFIESENFKNKKKNK